MGLSFIISVIKMPLHLHNSIDFDLTWVKTFFQIKVFSIVYFQTCTVYGYIYLKIQYLQIVLVVVTGLRRLAFVGCEFEGELGCFSAVYMKYNI